MLWTLVIVSLCEALTLTILVYGLAVAKCTTNSYHLDLVALSILAPSIYAANQANGKMPRFLLFLASAGAVVVLKVLSTGLATLPARRRKAGSATLTIISFAIFQLLMVLFSLVLSNRSFSVDISKRSISVLWARPIRFDEMVVIVSGCAVLLLLSISARVGTLVPLLKALRDNPDLLAQYNFDETAILWKGTLLAVMLSAAAGFLTLVRSAVGPNTVYNLFFLVFAVLLLAEEVRVGRTFVIAGLVALVYNTSVGLTAAVHKPLVSSAMLMGSCLFRYWRQARS